MSMRPNQNQDLPKMDVNAAVPLEDDGAPHTKRSRLSVSPLLNKLQHNPLTEPKPLGLKLKKSPSLLELIQTRLSEATDLNDYYAAPVAAAPAENATKGDKKEGKKEATASASDKGRKALNFNASAIRIGSWEFVSRYDGDLVAKCYFAKKKLVWEVLDGGLKSKIDIQWADIISLKTDCPLDDSPGTMTVVLARRPLFSRETSPQPRKHTLWQASSDFTKGQASIHRTHVLQCPAGVLKKNFEKLIQRDERLNLLSKLPDFPMDSLYFDAKTSHIGNPEDERNCFELFNGEASPMSSFHDGASPSLSRDGSSSSSGMDIVEGNSYGNQSAAKTLNIGGLHHSMSMTDLMSQIGQHVSQGVSSGTIPSDKAAECKNVLETVADILLSDTPSIADSDERLMKKVNSLCCLLQYDPAPAPPENPIGTGSNAAAGGVKSEINPSHDSGNSQPPGGMQRIDSFGDFLLNLPRIASFPNFANPGSDAAAGAVKSEINPSHDSGNSQPPGGMQRIDSFGDFLLNLPRIASFPNFLYGIDEDSENKFQ